MSCPQPAGREDVLHVQAGMRGFLAIGLLKPDPMVAALNPRAYEAEVRNFLRLNEFPGQFSRELANGR